MKIFYLLLFFPVHFVYAQQKTYDSLRQLLAVEKVDTQKLNLFNQLANAALSIDARKALDFARQGVLMAENSGEKTWLPRLCETAGRMHANLMQLDSANVFYEKAMAGYTSNNDKKGQANVHLKFAWVHRRKGEFAKALAIDLKALRILEGLDDKNDLAKAYGFISEDLTRQERFKEAMEYARKAIDICEKNNISGELVYALWNAGNVSIAMGNDKQSLEYYNQALDMTHALNFTPRATVQFINGRGNALKHLKQYQLALDDYNHMLVVARETNFPMGVSSAIANLGEVNMLMGHYDEALRYQLETVMLQEKNGDLTNLTENYQHVSTIYEKLGDYRLALEYQKKARRMRDSVASAQSDAAMSQLLTQYQAEKKEATIAAQEKELAQQKTVQWLSIGVGVLLTGLLIVGYRSLRSRSKSNMLLAAKNAENELLLKEIHHRVKNNLEVVSSLLALQSAQIDDPHTREAMLEGQNRVHSIGIVHQKLYLGENPGSIEMKDYFINLSESILDAFGAEGRVTVELAMEKLNVDIDTAVPLGLIVNELLTNTLKYAFPGNQPGKVRIKLEQQTSGILQLEVSDNGIGKSGLTHGTGFGGQLVSLLTRQLDGSMKEEIKNGTHHFFEFKSGKVA